MLRRYVSTLYVSDGALGCPASTLLGSERVCSPIIMWVMDGLIHSADDNRTSESFGCHVSSPLLCACMSRVPQMCAWMCLYVEYRV
eukprot:34621-Eustigmatos_ZCMA.PRE.1